MKRSAPDAGSATQRAVSRPWTATGTAAGPMPISIPAAASAAACAGTRARAAQSRWRRGKRQEKTMQVIEQDGLKITVDDDGFLANIDDWTEQVARILAAREGIPDLPEHRLDILALTPRFRGTGTGRPGS